MECTIHQFKLSFTGPSDERTVTSLATCYTYQSAGQCGHKISLTMSTLLVLHICLSHA